MSSPEGQPTPSAVSAITEKYIADAIARRQTTEELGRALIGDENLRYQTLREQVVAGIKDLVKSCVEVEIPHRFPMQRRYVPIPMGLYDLSLPWQEDKSPRSVFVQPFLLLDVPVIDEVLQDLNEIKLEVYAARESGKAQATGNLDYGSNSVNYMRIARRNLEHGDLQYETVESLRRLEGFAPLLEETLAHVPTPTHL